MEDRLGLPFTGLVSFLRSRMCPPEDLRAANIAVLGIPSDEGSGWLPGARFGPRKLREVSMRFRGGVIQGSGGFWDIDEDHVYLAHELANDLIVDCGDVDVVVTRPDATWDNATNVVRQVLDAGAFPVVLGGDHGITYPVVRAFSRPLTVVHFDAHVDYQPFTHGVIHSHAQPMRMVRTLSNVERILQLGVRSFRTPQQDVRDSLDQGNQILSVRTIRETSQDDIWAPLADDTLVYASIDVDVLDPPLVPGTGSPEPSGLTYDELRSLLLGLATRVEIVGFDLVEVNPLIDVRSDVTSFIGVQLIIEFLSRIVEHPHYKSRHYDLA